MNTYFENLENLLVMQKNCGLARVAILKVEKAMEKDQHQLFHDAEWTDGCSICNTERQIEAL